MKNDNKGKMIAFRVQSKTTQAKLNKFCRKFYGYTDKSCHGKYTYKRKGLLDDIPHINPIRSLLIVKNEDCDKVVLFLEKYNAEIFVRNVILEETDMEKLKIESQEGDQNDAGN